MLTRNIKIFSMCFIKLWDERVSMKARKVYKTQDFNLKKMIVLEKSMAFKEFLKNLENNCTL